MFRINRSTALAIGFIALLAGAVGPWISVLGAINGGPTNDAELSIVIFGGAGVVLLSALTQRFQRIVSIVVGLLTLGEAIPVLVRVHQAKAQIDSDWANLVAPGWGLYLTILAGAFLILSTFITDRSLRVAPVVESPS